ncbi:hypothetical protein [Candidatus Regiella endosymbiont of Tuberolachnus salignus]
MTGMKASSQRRSNLKGEGYKCLWTLQDGEQIWFNQALLPA